LRKEVQVAQLGGQATQVLPPKRKVPCWQVRHTSVLVVIPVVLSVVTIVSQARQFGSILEKLAHVSRKAQAPLLGLNPAAQTRQPVASQLLQLEGQAMQERLSLAR
jgi:hypothetical protein